MNAAAVRIAVSSSTFRRPLAAGALTQLEWLERCSSVLAADGVLAAREHFPRRDAEYVAQLRKIAVDLGLVPFGLDDGTLLDPAQNGQVREDTFGLASGFGAMVIRTRLPAPGEVPPAAFVEAVALGKQISRAAKAANVTVLISAAPGTLGEELAGVKHFVKDVDSAWLRACPSALVAAEPKDRFPAVTASAEDDPLAVAQAARRSWVLLDLAESDDPWSGGQAAVERLRLAEGDLVRRDRSGRLAPG